MSDEKYNEMLSQSESLRLLKDENQKLEDKRRAMEDESGRLRTGLDAARQQMQSVQSKLAFVQAENHSLHTRLDDVRKQLRYTARSLQKCEEDLRVERTERRLQEECWTEIAAQHQAMIDKNLAVSL